MGWRFSLCFIRPLAIPRFALRQGGSVEEFLGGTTSPIPGLGHLCLLLSKWFTGPVIQIPHLIVVCHVQTVYYLTVWVSLCICFLEYSGCVRPALETPLALVSREIMLFVAQPTDRPRMIQCLCLCIHIYMDRKDRMTTPCIRLYSSLATRRRDAS